MPAKKIIHERSVSDARRPNRRSAWTAGTSGMSTAAGQPKNDTSGCARYVPTTPTLAWTLASTRGTRAQLRERQRDERAGEEHRKQQQRDPQDLALEGGTAHEATALDRVRAW